MYIVLNNQAIEECSQQSSFIQNRISPNLKFNYQSGLNFGLAQIAHLSFS
jgi:hypothetical protein